MQQRSSATEFFWSWAIPAQAAGGRCSRQGPKPWPSPVHVCKPQNSQNELKQTRSLPGMQVSQREGHALHRPPTQYCAPPPGQGSGVRSSTLPLQSSSSPLHASTVGRQLGTALEEGGTSLSPASARGGA